MAEIINDQVVLDANEREMLRRNLLHPDFEKLNEINKFYGGIDITMNDDCSWTASCTGWNFNVINDLTIQN